MLSLAAQSDVRPRASVLKFCYLPVANGGLAAVPNGAINGDLFYCAAARTTTSR